MTKARKQANRYGEDSDILNADGFAQYPNVLDDYERALGLSVHETWLLKRLMRHAWESDRSVYPSMRAIVRESRIGNKTLNGVVKSLEKKGYIKRTDYTPTLTDKRVRWSLLGLYDALGFCCGYDSTSKFSKEGGEFANLEECATTYPQRYPALDLSVLDKRIMRLGCEEWTPTAQGEGEGVGEGEDGLNAIFGAAPAEGGRVAAGVAIPPSQAQSDELLSALEKLVGRKLDKANKTEKGYIADLREWKAQPSECQHFANYWHEVMRWRGEDNKPTLKDVRDRWDSVKAWTPGAAKDDRYNPSSPNFRARPKPRMLMGNESLPKRPKSIFIP